MEDRRVIAAVAKWRERPALTFEGRTLTYGELDALANRFARLLIDRGVAPGDRVLLALEGSITFVGCYFGTMRAGAVAVPLPAGPRSDRLATAVSDATPAACVVDPATVGDPHQAEALGTVPHYFALGGEPLGVHPFLRLTPPRRLADFEPEHVLCGHGEGVHEHAAEAVREALAHARRRLPRLLVEAPAAAMRR